MIVMLIFAEFVPALCVVPLIVQPAQAWDPVIGDETER